LGKRFVDFIIAHPWRALLGGLVVLMAIMPGGQHITADFSYRVWFNDDDPLIVEFDAFERRFGNDEVALVIVHSPSGMFDEESATLLRGLTEKMWGVHDIIRVTSLANYNWVRSEVDAECAEECEDTPEVCKEECEELMISELIPDPEEEPWTDGLLAARGKIAVEHELLPNYLVSKDGKTAMVYASLRPALIEHVDYEVVTNGIAAVIAKYEGQGDHVFYQSGTPIMNSSFKNAAMTDMGRLIPIALGLTIFFLLVIFRRLSGVVLPLIVIGLSVMATMTTSGWLGISISNTTSLLPQILLAIAVADSVHVLHTYFYSLGLGTERREAARHTLKKNLKPTLLTSVTTALGFMSFSTAAVVPIGHLGVLAAIGTLYAWLITYFILGPLLVLLPIKPRAGANPADAKHTWSPALTNFMVRQRKPIMGVYLVASVVALYLAAQSDANSDPFEYFPDDFPLNEAATFLEDNVGGALPVEIVLDCGEVDGFKDPAWLGKVDTFQAWLVDKPHITSAVSIVDILKAMNRSINYDEQAFYKIPKTRKQVAQLKLLYEQGLPQGMNVNDRVPIQNDAVRITTQWTMHDSKSVLDEMEAIVAEAEKRGLKAHITGKGQLWQRMNPYVVETFVVSLSAAVVAMTLLLMIVLRSWKLGLLAMIPNGAPLIMGGAMLHAIGKPLDVGTVVVFSVCLGIAVDDTIHFLANYHRLTGEGKSPREAIREVFAHTMPALVVTTGILVCAFGVFMFATFVPNRYFGLLVAFVLTVALATDATLLPALLADDEPKGSTTAPSQ